MTISDIENRFVTRNSNQYELPTLKEGIKLPKSIEDWLLANMYLH